MWAALKEHDIEVNIYSNRIDRDIFLVPEAGVDVRVHNASSCELGCLLEEVAEKTFSVRTVAAPSALGLAANSAHAL